MTELEYRPIVESEKTALYIADHMGFGAEPSLEQEHIDLVYSVLPIDRTVAAFDGEAIVGTLGDFPLQLTVPGGAQVAAAGTTLVTVRATHRRRGILREMMHRHLAMAAERGDPVVCLWASEPAIYGRFGFGVATELHEVEFDARLVDLAPLPADVSLAMIEPSEAVTIAGPFWSAQARSDRPGFIDRSDAFWAMYAADPEHRRGDGSASRHIVARRDDEVVGYVAYRQHRKWETLPEGKIEIQAMVAADTDARRALWNYASNIDLFPHVEFWDGMVQDPVAYESSNARAVERSVSDGLYVRLLDLPVALAARTYESDGSLVIDVRDDLGYAAGRFFLSVIDGKAAVEVTEAAADITVDVRELGALYLGRAAVPMQAEMGLLRGSDGSIAMLDRIFRTRRAPWCPEEF